MNFEELLNSQDGVATHREELPWGVFYKKLIDKKYRNVLELKPELADNIVFCEGLKADHEHSQTIGGRLQLSYELHADSGGVYEIEIEQGNYQTFAQLIDSNPAVVAKSGFIDNAVKALCEATELLNSAGVYHLCFAPQTIFCRKADYAPMLLFHGSSFLSMTDMQSLFGGFEEFVAPEVLRGEGADERSDVYSLGKFIEWIYQHGDMPYEYKTVVARATQTDPLKRYGSVADMRSDLLRKRNLKQTCFSLVGALAIALLLVGAYFEFMPQTEHIEFVQGVEKEDFGDEILDQGFNEETELGVWGSEIDVEQDTLLPEERKQMMDYQAKSEELFRKQFTKAADRVLKKIYSQDRMSLNEQTFVADNQAMAQELLKMQGEMAKKAGISDQRASDIAASVIEELQKQRGRQKSEKKYGFQRGGDDDER